MRSRSQVPLVVSLVVLGAAGVVIGTVLPSYGLDLHPSPSLRFVGAERISIIGGIGEKLGVYAVAMALQQWASALVAIVSAIMLSWGPEHLRQIARGGVAAAGAISGFAGLYWIVNRLTSDWVWFAPMYILICGHMALLLAGVLSLRSGAAEAEPDHATSAVREV